MAIELEPFELIRTEDRIFAVVDPDPGLALVYLVRNVAERLDIRQRLELSPSTHPQLMKLIGEKALENKAIFELKSDHMPTDHGLSGAIAVEANYLPELEGEMLPVGLLDATQEPPARARLICQPSFQSSRDTRRAVFVKQAIDSSAADLS